MTDRPLLIYIIYDHPRDYPEHFVCRRQIIQGGEISFDERFFLQSENLETIRQFCREMKLYCFPRFENDDPVILETWI